MVLFSGDDVRTIVDAHVAASLSSLARMSASGEAARLGADALALRLGVRSPVLHVAAGEVAVRCPPGERRMRVTFAVPFDGEASHFHAALEEALDDDDLEVDGTVLRIHASVPVTDVGRDPSGAARAVLSRLDAVVEDLRGRLDALSDVVAEANDRILRAVTDALARSARAEALRGALEAAARGRSRAHLTAVAAPRHAVEGFGDGADDHPDAAVPRLVSSGRR